MGFIDWAQSKPRVPSGKAGSVSHRRIAPPVLRDSVRQLIAPTHETPNALIELSGSDPAFANASLGRKGFVAVRSKGRR